MKKSAVRQSILEQLRQELLRQTQAAELARDEAISEESRAENKWDTHSQEAAYLAEGQAKLAGEVRASIDVYATLPLPEFSRSDAIGIGALVAIEQSSGRRAWYLIGPRAGGLEIPIAELQLPESGSANASTDPTLLVLTPQSPLGRQLLGRRVGDEIQVQGRGGIRTTQRIVEVI